MAFIVLWDRTSTFAAITAPLVGLSSGLIAWMVATKVRSGTISIATTGDVYNSLTGDCVSLGMGLVCIILFSYLVPDKKKPVQVIEGEEVVAQEETIVDKKAEEGVGAAPTDKETDIQTNLKPSLAQTLKPVLEEPVVPICALTPAQVRSQKRLALIALIVGTLGFMIVLPFSLYGTGYVFSKGFFYGYVIVAFIWAWTSFIICVLMPLWESWGDIWYIVGAVCRDLRRRKIHVVE
jgi:urea-proton symporter